MNLNLSRIFYRLGIINHNSEFFVILTWMIFFPDKESQVYFLGTAILLCLFLLRNIYFMKTVNLSYFTYSLSGFNLLLILLSFFSNYHLKSILFLSDLLLVSLYFILFYRDPRGEEKHFYLVVHIISLFSLVNIIRLSVPIFPQEKPFFISTIHEGVLSGMGVLILLYYLMKKSRFKPWFLTLLLLNTAGLYAARSKAAFAGTLAFSLLIIFSFILTRLEKKKRFIVLVIVGAAAAGAVMLTFVIRNPIKSAFDYSLKKDPYALNRIDIWKMSLTIFKDHPLTGVGLGNFSEVSRRYNFKQTRGPANYFKRPRITHNDYLQLMTETGITGLLIILVLFFSLVKKIFSSSLPDLNISKILILYLLAQAFLFNILFNGFFFFIFLFLLKNLLEGNVTFKSFSSRLKLFLSGLVILVLIASYLFPWAAAGLIKKSQKAAHPAEAFSLLKKAGYLNPLDQDIYYLKAFSLYNYFKQTSSLEAFYDAVNHLKKAQRLNKYFINAYLLEFDLYRELLKKKIKYVSMDEEIIAPLEKAEVYAPVDPFIKLKKARIYLEFNKNVQAKEEALKAVNLEPEFAAARYFLQRNFNFYGDEKTFKEGINKILDKAEKLKPEPGRYLYRLYEVPKDSR
jgi:O-antigen ligase